jgi:hypothetical protein
VPATREPEVGDNTVRPHSKKKKERKKERSKKKAEELEAVI